MYNPGTTNKNRLPVILIILFSAALVALNIVRIINVPITHDEGWTYTAFITSTYRNIIVNSPITANNHIFNSLLAKFFTGLFQSSTPFIIRLPNLLALILYILSAYGLLQKLFKNEWWVLAGLLLLTLNPFLFDFWGLCRGYGLAISLMMAAVYFFISYDINARPLFLFTALLLGGLATLSNFSILNFYLALIAVVVLQAIIAPQAVKRLRIKWAVAAIVICTLLLYVIIVHPIMELRERGELYFGGNEGFIADTVKSLVAESVYNNKTSGWVTGISYVAIVLPLLASAMFVFQLFKNRYGPHLYRYSYVVLLLFIPALSTILQFHLLGTLFLIERTTLFFYPLWVLAIIISLFSLKHIKPLSLGLLCLLILASGYNFLQHINTSYSRVWDYDRYDRLVIERMTAHTPHPVKVKLYWMFINSFKYYSLTAYKNEMAYVEGRFDDSVYAPQEYDYYYIHRADMGWVPSGYVIDTTFFDGKYVLLKKQ